MRLHIWISGKVQGVWFRESLRARAEAVGVKGWVRNLPDGRVEALLDGAEEAVEDLAAWCRRGPESAIVADVDEKEEREDVQGPMVAFRVLRG